MVERLATSGGRPVGHAGPLPDGCGSTAKYGSGQEGHGVLALGNRLVDVRHRELPDAAWRAIRRGGRSRAKHKFARLRSLADGYAGCRVGPVRPGLTERRIRLVTRMEVGVPAAAFELARQCGSRISRGDYHRLIKAGLSSIDAIEQGSDAPLLACLDGKPEKLAVLRQAVEDHRRSEHEKAPIKTMPAYEAD